MREWDKQIAEPNLWYGRFHEYMLLGHTRTVVAVYNKDRKRRRLPPNSRTFPASWSFNSKKWKWADRAVAYDNHIHQENLYQYEQRQREQREIEWNNSQLLQSKVDTLCKLPMVKQTLEKDGKTIVIEPIDFSLRDLPHLVQAQSETARRATDMDAAPSVKSTSNDLDTDTKSFDADFMKALDEITEWDGDPPSLGIIDDKKPVAEGVDDDSSDNSKD